MRKIVAVAVLAGLMGFGPAGEARADEGGYVDPQTGLVWSTSLLSLTDSWWTWAPAMNQAATYSVWDLNEFGVPTLYDDWRLPTIREVQTAIADGTIDMVVPRNPDGTIMWGSGTNEVWTSESKGNKAWRVSVIVNAARTHVIGGGQAALFVKNGWAGDAFMVRP